MLGEFCSEELEWFLFPLDGTSVQLDGGLFKAGVSSMRFVLILLLFEAVDVLINVCCGTLIALSLLFFFAVLVSACLFTDLDYDCCIVNYRLGRGRSAAR